ncbi:olfactory receptor 1D2-like, partial [Vombatus ursinus]|uniref:olfactory receptor 1D2-like n=1 Tax=Vombatus ursinus TaxID=29139 RepID=UPI000FFD29F2
HLSFYFFFANLTFTDVCFVSNTVPKMLVNLFTQKKAISYTGCLIQLYFLVSLVALDNLLLVVMAYGRFVAICRPLHYTTIMSPRLCILRLVPCWVLSIPYGLTHTILMATLPFCGHREISHIFCEMYVLLQLACSDTRVNQAVLLSTGSLLFIVPFLLMLISYVQIAKAILRIPSVTGKYKAFSTCASHLAVVSLFYGTLFGVYLQPVKTYSVKDSVATVMYAVVTPMFNPFIYSLRNQDMKGALKKLLRGKTVP